MAAGDTVNAADTALDAWTTYTPVWSANSGSTVLGNGAITGRYRITGKTGMLNIGLTWGTTTSATGTGSWAFSLPFTPLANGLLLAYVDDASASQRWAGTARIIASSSTGDNMRVVMLASNGGINGAANPMTWAANDLLILHGTLEIA